MFIFTILKIFIGTPIEYKVTKDSKENILPFHLKEKKMAQKKFFYKGKEILDIFIMCKGIS